MLLVDVLINKFQTDDPIKIAEGQNIKIVYKAMPEKIRSTVVYDQDNKFIVLNTRISQIAQVANCANRLGEILIKKRSPESKEKVAHWKVDDLCNLNAHRYVFFMDLLMQHGMYNENTFARVNEENGVPLHISEKLLNGWREFKRRESGLYTL